MNKKSQSQPIKLPGMKCLLRNNFFAGLMVVIPMGVALWLLASVAQLLWGLQDLLPETVKPDHWISSTEGIFILKAILTVFLTVGSVFLISIAGWISKKLIGRRIINAFSNLIQRIPVIRSIYSTLEQLLRTMASGGGQQFNRVVYIEYPRKGILALAFVTSEAKGPNLPPGYLNVFVPTTPNPTSGFHLIVPEAEIKESQLKVEEAFKTILSLGMAQGET